MTDAMSVAADEVAEVPAGETSPNLDGKHEVAHVCGGCSAPIVIHIPDGHTDHVVRYEHACSKTQVHKGEWPNPDGVAPILDPGDDDDVMWDASRREYVPRVAVAVSEEGTGGEAAIKA